MDSLRSGRVGLAVACPATGIVLGTPAAAFGSQATLRSGVLEIVAGRGETNRIEIERAFSAGSVIEIRVRPVAASIGKRTRFVIRAGAAPRRVDSCLMPASARLVRCPR